MEVKVLGPGCAKCKSTLAIVEKVIRESGRDIKLTKVDDIVDIMAYNVIATPAVVVDEVVKIKGRIPTEDEVKRALSIQ